MELWSGNDTVPVGACGVVELLEKTYPVGEDEGTCGLGAVPNSELLKNVLVEVAALTVIADTF